MNQQDEGLHRETEILLDESEPRAGSQYRSHIRALSAALLEARADREDAERYRWLRENCGHSYGESYGDPAPAECGIHFDWQQSKPGETGNIDRAIDAARKAGEAK